MSAGPGGRAEVVCVGDELLSGRVADLNAAWLGARLAERGWPVRRVVMVADDVEVIAAAVTDAVGRAELVVVTGGLGGTSDDVTRAALAQVAGAAVVRDAALEAALRARYRDAEPPVGALTMCDVVQGAEVLANPAGTAPGQRMGVGGATVVLLPGVPREVVAIAESALLPALGGGAVVTRSLHLPLADEARVGDALAALERSLPAGVRVGYLAAASEVEVRLTGRGADRAAVEALLEPVVSAARGALERVEGLLVLDAPLPASLVQALTGLGQTMACAESLTGGLVAATVVDVPGASAVLRGGVVSYATDVKASALGVPADLLAERGAVDPDVARAMAAGVRSRLGADWGVSTTGVAGPDPQDGHPVGEVHVAVDGPRSASRVIALRGGRERIRHQAAVAALRLLLECVH
ncbi:nicotinamide-nucleotide amidase [Motilibacter peucedani]|uniref:CinA-like protein n=1 Tax=Motilibacter peucedani TaxID=598650 RepID=A0A420XR92_9ACTN|nr:nicotinamide-nucleotide amidohydrolase family protein [Motilibacter peucedani]RKS77423.1 nicotinamide-nucleotide amidase [Motilibacter peucedani]